MPPLAVCCGGLKIGSKACFENAFHPPVPSPARVACGAVAGPANVLHRPPPREVAPGGRLSGLALGVSPDMAVPAVDMLDGHVPQGRAGAVSEFSREFVASAVKVQPLLLRSLMDISHVANVSPRKLLQKGTKGGRRCPSAGTVQQTRTDRLVEKFVPVGRPEVARKEKSAVAHPSSASLVGSVVDLRVGGGRRVKCHAFLNSFVVSSNS